MASGGKGHSNLFMVQQDHVKAVCGLYNNIGYQVFKGGIHNYSKLCNQVRSLDHFVVQNSGDFLC